MKKSSKKLACAKCGGVKMKKGGESGGARSAKALMENMGTSGQYGKMRDGGILDKLKEKRAERKVTKTIKKSVMNSGKPIAKVGRVVDNGDGPSADVRPLEYSQTMNPKGIAGKVAKAGAVRGYMQKAGLKPTLQSIIKTKTNQAIAKAKAAQIKKKGGTVKSKKK